MVAVMPHRPVQRWRVVAGGEAGAPLASSLAAELRESAQFVAAHPDEPVDHVVYVAGSGAPASACADILALLETLRRAPPARLWLVTRGATSVGPVVEPLHAALWGMARVIAVEAPEYRCTCVDLGARGERPAPTSIPTRSRCSWASSSTGATRSRSRSEAGGVSVPGSSRCTRCLPALGLSSTRMLGIWSAAVTPASGCASSSGWWNEEPVTSSRSADARSRSCPLLRDNAYRRYARAASR